jgi:hypothetical protein
MKAFFLKLIGLGLVFASPVPAQTTYSYSIHQIIDSTLNNNKGIILPDGNVIRAKLFVTGTAAAAAGHSAQSSNLGGTFDNDPPGPASTDYGNTLPSYKGDKHPDHFTALRGKSKEISGGMGNNAQNALGIHIFFDRPAAGLAFLGLDLDGVQETGATTSGNSEWMAALGYNGSTFVSITGALDGNTELRKTKIDIDSLHKWNRYIKSQKPGAELLPDEYNVYRQAPGGETGKGNADPDETTNQVYFSASTAVTDFFMLWGIWPTTTDGTQNSGISPFTLVQSPDFGDNPASYKSLLADEGPSHAITSSLKMGNTNTTEADGSPSATAGSDSGDDGVFDLKEIPNSGATSQVIPNYELETVFVNTTGLDAHFVAWIDWNNNGQFEASEGKTLTKSSSNAAGTIKFIWENETLSGEIGKGYTFARIRVTTDLIGVNDVGGGFKDGEVEDYKIGFATVLPVNLVSFEGSYSERIVNLAWSTTEEKLIDKYEIQRGENASDFKAIGYLVSNSASSDRYEFKDQSPVPGNNYYRLRVVEMDQSYWYSKILRVEAGLATDPEVILYPNPTDNILYFKTNIINPVFTITDIHGIPYSLQSFTLPAGQNGRIDLSKLPKGLYILQFGGSDNKHTRGRAKLIIKQ